MIESILTIGAHGFDAATFAQRLRDSCVDLFIDIRARRGVRGAGYAFANSERLQASLSAAGIAYTHAKELAPSEEVRQAQWAADAASKIKKRDRSRLSDAFAAAFAREALGGFDSHRFIATHCGSAHRPVLFCVEREPMACHRSLVADRLAKDLNVPIVHLLP